MIAGVLDNRGESVHVVERMITYAVVTCFGPTVNEIAILIGFLTLAELCQVYRIDVVRELASWGAGMLLRFFGPA